MIAFAKQTRANLFIRMKAVHLCLGHMYIDAYLYICLVEALLATSFESLLLWTYGEVCFCESQYVVTTFS